MTDTQQWRALTVCGLATVAIACGPDPQPAPSEAPPIEPAQEARVAPAADAPDPTIAAALDAIRDRQQCNRVMGCKPATQLLQKGEEAVSPILEAVSRSKSDGYWRVRLVELLGQLRHARATPVLEQLLRSNLWEIRCRAAIALGRLGARKSAPALQAMLARHSDPDDPVTRVAALVALDRLGADMKEPSARERLARELPTDEATLGPLNPGYYMFLAESVREARLTKAMGLARLGARHRDRFVREASLRTLGALQDTGGIAVTVGRLDDPLPSIRRLAIATLQQITGSYTLTSADQWKAWCDERACRGPRTAPSPEP